MTMPAPGHGRTHAHGRVDSRKTQFHRQHVQYRRRSYFSIRSVAGSTICPLICVQAGQIARRKGVYNGEETNKNASSQNRQPNRRAFDTSQITSLHVFLRRVSFMRHLKKICGPHKHQICGGNMRKYGRELLEANCPISFHRGRTHG